MMRLFYAAPGAGKTSVCAAMGSDRMHGEFARQRLKIAQTEAALLNANGFNVSPPPNDHLVFTYKFTIDVTSPVFGRRVSYTAYPVSFGFAADGFDPWFVHAGSTLILDEFQSIYDSRNWQSFPENVSRAYEQHRKKQLDIWIISQEPSLLEKRIRLLCQITYVADMQIYYNDWGEIEKVTWTLYNWRNYESWQRRDTPDIEEYTYYGNVYKIYDTLDGVQLFYAGIGQKDFKTVKQSPVELTPDGIAKYAAENPIHITKKGEK